MTEQGELDRIAREAAPEVLAAALVRARTQAETRLADLLTEAIVAQALAGCPAERSHPEPAGETRGSCYAYAVTRADLRYPAGGPALTPGRPVDLVREGDLGLLVSPVAPAELEVDADDLSESGRLAVLARGHDAVVRAAADQGPVLPLRFGTVVPDEDAARRLLLAHAAAAREQLQRIGTAREWGVRLVRALGPDAEPALAGRADANGVSGTEYLSRRRQALQREDDVTRSAAESADRMQDRLAAHVSQSLRRGGSPGSSLLMDMAYLVPTLAESDFLAEVQRLADDVAARDLSLELTGPWPPYSFAVLTPEVPDGP